MSCPCRIGPRQAECAICYRPSFDGPPKFFGLVLSFIASAEGAKWNGQGVSLGMTGKQRGSIKPIGRRAKSVPLSQLRPHKNKSAERSQPVSWDLPAVEG
jgi:hypothetical protein